MVIVVRLVIKCFVVLKCRHMKCLLRAHNVYDAGQYDHLDPCLTQRLGKRTMTQSSFLHVLGVAFQCRSYAALRPVFTGLNQLHARDERSLSERRGAANSQA